MPDTKPFRQPRQLTEQEFDAIKTKVLDAAPKDLDEASFLRWVGPRMEQAVAEAEYTDPAPEGSSLARFAEGVWNNLNPVNLVQGIYQPFKDPLGTAQQIGAASAEQFGKAKEAFSEGEITEGVGRAAATVPLVGPAAAAAGERLGSGDIAGGLGEATGLVAPVVAPAVARQAMRAVPEGVATSLERGAAARVENVMTPKGGQNAKRFGNMASEVAEQLVNEGRDTMAWSREGFHRKVADSLDTAGSKLDEAADKWLSGSPVSTAPILKALRERRQRLISEPLKADKLDSPATKYDRASEEFRKQREPIGEETNHPTYDHQLAVLDDAIARIEKLGPIAPYEALRRFRAGADAAAKVVYHPSMGADFLKMKGGAIANADVAGAIRETLAATDPRRAAANAEYSLYRQADDVLKATEEVERVRPKVGRQIMARLTGSVVGQQAAGIPGAVAGFVLGPVLDAAVSSGMTTKLATATLMKNLAKAVRGGNVNQVTSLTAQLESLGKRLGVQATGLTGKETSDGAKGRK